MKNVKIDVISIVSLLLCNIHTRHVLSNRVLWKVFGSATHTLTTSEPHTRHINSTNEHRMLDKRRMWVYVLCCQRWVPTLTSNNFCFLRWILECVRRSTHAPNIPCKFHLRSENRFNIFFYRHFIQLNCIFLVTISNILPIAIPWLNETKKQTLNVTNQYKCSNSMHIV